MCKSGNNCVGAELLSIVSKHILRALSTSFRASLEHLLKCKMYKIDFRAKSASKVTFGPFGPKLGALGWLIVHIFAINLFIGLQGGSRRPNTLRLASNLSHKQPLWAEKWPKSDFFWLFEPEPAACLRQIVPISAPA